MKYIHILSLMLTSSSSLIGYVHIFIVTFILSDNFAFVTHHRNSHEREKSQLHISVTVTT